MNDFDRLIQLAGLAGQLPQQVDEAEECDKCEDCGCEPCECDADKNDETELTEGDLPPWLKKDDDEDDSDDDDEDVKEDCGDDDCEEAIEEAFGDDSGMAEIAALRKMAGLTEPESEMDAHTGSLGSNMPGAMGEPELAEPEMPCAMGEPDPEMDLMDPAMTMDPNAANDQEMVIIQLDDGHGMMDEDEDEFGDELEPEDDPDAMVDLGDAPDTGYKEKGVELEPDVPVDRNAGGIDSYELIQTIQHMQDSGMSMANANYDPERLMDMPIDRVVNVYKKVMGEQIGEEDENWGGEAGYAADSECSHVTHDARDMFPTGQATNAVKRVSNTAGGHSDNPMSTVDPIMVGETVEEIHEGLKQSFSDFSKNYAKKK